MTRHSWTGRRGKWQQVVDGMRFGDSYKCESEADSAALRQAINAQTNAFATLRKAGDAYYVYKNRSPEFEPLEKI